MLQLGDINKIKVGNVKNMKNFEEYGIIIGKILNEKNAAYGNSFEKAGGVLKILFPEGIKPEQYDDMLAIVRILDKLFRIATQPDAYGENPWQDLAGYSILGWVIKEEKQK